MTVTATTGQGVCGTIEPGELLQSITEEIEAATNVHETIGVLLHRICEATGWPLGQAWTRNGASYLECSHAWCADHVKLQPFRDRSEAMTFEPGVGLPGRAWSTRRPIWVKDLRSEDLPRGPFALEVGIVAGIAVPVLAGDDNVVAVLEFLMTESRPADGRFLALTAWTAAHLGSVLRRKQADEALRASEESFRLLVESVDDVAICRLDPSGRIASWNAGARQILGYQADEIIGYHLARFYPAEAVQNGDPERHLEEAEAGGRFQESDWRVRADGLRVWAESVIVPLRNAAGETRGYSYLIRDHTAQHETDEELSRLRSMIESSDDAIISLTPGRGIITTWNAGAERLFGYTAREVVGRCVGLLLAGDRGREQLRRIEDDLAMGRVARPELEVVRKNGSRIDVSATFSPIVRSNGETSGVTVVARDVSNAKCRQRRMKRTMGTYLDRDVTEWIIRGDGSPVGAAEEQATVVFVDIRDFTQLSEELPPRQAVATLNRFFEVTVPVITAHGGHVNKFIGDGFLAVFGLDGDESHADRALAAALALVARVQEEFGEGLEAGVGIHSGDVIAGNIGGGGRLDFTVIGDVVNTAARIEAATRHTGDSVLMSEAVRRRLRDRSMVMADRPSVPMKGKRQAVRLFAPVQTEAVAA